MDIQGSPICLTDSDHDFIMYEIKRRDTNEYKITMSVDYRRE